MSYSGQFADPGAQIDNGIKLYMKQNGDTVAGRKIELIRKDSGGVAPDVAKRLSQEVIVRDGAGGSCGLRPHAERARRGRHLGAGQEVHGQHERGTSVITTKSPFMVRTSFTVFSAQRGARHLGLQERRAKGVYARLRLRARPRRRGRLHKGFKDAGGEIIGSARYPVANLDFTAFLQRAKDANPDGLYIWVPGGPQPAAIGKAIAERGIDKSKVKVMGQGELTYEDALKSMGDAGLGLITAFHYDFYHQSAKNKAFVAAYNAEFKRNPDMFSVGGYDGMHAIYEALKKTGGKTDGEALIEAVKGMSWESPRGPMRSIRRRAT